ncbi:MAG TPA: tetratricopeptide repeat protein, partial [Rudaea sp.]|nr:tetratricopeptide repeat protein [Rudaea sp.]
MKKSKIGIFQFLLCLSVALLLGANAQTALAKKHETRYPDATRTEPKNDLRSSTDQRDLQKGLDALNAGDDAKAEELLQKVLTTSKSKYAQGVALQGLANVKFNQQDFKGAIADYQQLLKLNSVSNDAYYDSMYNIANGYLAEGDYQAALDQLKAWREQSKAQTADSYALEGNINYRLDKYPEAIAAIKKAQSLTDKPKDAWNSILMASYAASGQGAQAADVVTEELAKDPTNKKLAHNALVVYFQSNQTDKALALLDREQKSGMITDSEDYISAARFYANFAQSTDKPELAMKGAQLLQQGFDKKAVDATMENYKLLGDAYMIAQQDDKALAAYDKASPLATNGDIDYRRAEVLGSQQKWKESKSVLEKAIARGVTHTGKANLLLGKLN